MRDYSNQIRDYKTRQANYIDIGALMRQGLLYSFIVTGVYITILFFVL